MHEPPPLHFYASAAWQSRWDQCQVVSYTTGASLPTSSPHPKDNSSLSLAPPGAWWLTAAWVSSVEPATVRRWAATPFGVVAARTPGHGKEICLDWRSPPKCRAPRLGQGTKSGLIVKAAIDTNAYSTAIKMTDAEFTKRRLKPHTFHGERNYSITPRP